jgi:phage pi2 protein 07
VFNKVDLTSWTVGASGTWAKFQFALGFNWRVGTSSDVLVRNLLNGDPLRTRIDVRTGGLIYSVSYQF